MWLKELCANECGRSDFMSNSAAISQPLGLDHQSPLAFHKGQCLSSHIVQKLTLPLSEYMYLGLDSIGIARLMKLVKCTITYTDW